VWLCVNPILLGLMLFLCSLLSHKLKLALCQSSWTIGKTSFYHLHSHIGIFSDGISADKNYRIIQLAAPGEYVYHSIRLRGELNLIMPSSRKSIVKGWSPTLRTVYAKIFNYFLLESNLSRRLYKVAS